MGLYHKFYMPTTTKKIEPQLDFDESPSINLQIIFTLISSTLYRLDTPFDRSAGCNPILVLYSDYVDQ